jgi:hypothetical protein
MVEMSFTQKIFFGDRRRCLDDPPARQNRISIWNFFGPPFLIFKNLSLGFLEMESVSTYGRMDFLGSPPLSQDPSFPLRRWLTNQHKLTLFDISSWNSNGDWLG